MGCAGLVERGCKKASPDSVLEGCVLGGVGAGDAGMSATAGTAGGGSGGRRSSLGAAKKERESLDGTAAADVSFDGEVEVRAEVEVTGEDEDNATKMGHDDGDDIAAEGMDVMDEFVAFSRAYSGAIGATGDLDDSGGQKGSGSGVPGGDGKKRISANRGRSVERETSQGDKHSQKGRRKKLRSHAV